MWNGLFVFAYVSSNGQEIGGIYRILEAESHLGRLVLIIRLLLVKELEMISGKEGVFMKGGLIELVIDRYNSIELQIQRRLIVAESK